MEKDTNKTKVIFRFWKESKSVIAIFPEHLGDSDLHTCSSYQHVGQHSACNPQMIVERSRPAKPEEYADLKAELEGPIGYNLEVILRYRYSHLNARRCELKRVREN
jgi:hypothetical protein